MIYYTLCHIIRCTDNFVTLHYFSEPNAGKSKENPILFRHLDNLKQFAATQQGSFWADISGELFIVIYSFCKQSMSFYHSESDTVLQMSEGSCGLYMMRVLTDEPVYRNSYPILEDECFVSPIVEVRVFPPVIDKRIKETSHTQY